MKDEQRQRVCLPVGPLFKSRSREKFSHRLLGEVVAASLVELGGDANHPRAATCLAAIEREADLAARAAADRRSRASPL